MVDADPVGHARLLDGRRDGRDRAGRPARRPVAVRRRAGGRAAPGRRSTCRRRARSATASSSTSRLEDVRFDAVLERLATLPDPLPAPADVLMPVIVGRDGPRPRGGLPPGRPGRPAAVLVLLYPDDDGDARVVLTERAVGRAPQRRGQLPGRQGRAGRRRHRRDRAARGGRGGRARRRRGRRPGGRDRSTCSGSRSATSRSRPSWPSPSAGP